MKLFGLLSFLILLNAKFEIGGLVMKKIGIITLFHNNLNYGAVLQAYALCKILNKNGHDAAQISYKHKFMSRRESSLHKARRMGIVLICRRVIEKIYNRLNIKKFSDIRLKLSDLFKRFIEDFIPHTEKVYDTQTIGETTNLYDSFITGSDQVWNGCEHGYYLDFVPSNKQKISYAPSIAKTKLTDIEIEALKKSLPTFDSISVREKEAVELLQGFTEKPIKLVADPTLLLSADDWEKVVKERKIDGDYVFCYFLGDNIKSKKIVKKFALEKGLKTIFVQLNYRLSSVFDSRYGDEILYDVSPGQFLYLIKNAKYVFTDSFHAMVFGFLFKKQFFVFRRNKNNEMSTRITSLATYFKSEHRVCFEEEKECLDYIDNCPEINYQNDFGELEKLKSFSTNFLLNSLEGKNDES